MCVCVIDHIWIYVLKNIFTTTQLLLQLIEDTEFNSFGSISATDTHHSFRAHATRSHSTPGALYLSGLFSTWFFSPNLHSPL